MCAECSNKPTFSPARPLRAEPRIIPKGRNDGRPVCRHVRCEKEGTRLGASRADRVR